MRKLPVFKGYTVDFRLQEIRKAVYGQALEFIPFDSVKGQKILGEFLKTPEGEAEVKYQTAN